MHKPIPTPRSLTEQEIQLLFQAAEAAPLQNLHVASALMGALQALKLWLPYAKATVLEYERQQLAAKEPIVNE